MLFAFTVSSHDLVIWALAGIVAALLGALWFRYDEWREDRRRKRIDLAATLSEAKLHFLSELAKDLAVVDLSGLYAHIKALLERVKTPADVLVLLKENFDWQLAERLKDVDQRAKIVAAINEFLSGVNPKPPAP